MEVIRPWWKGISGERFWLGVVREEQGQELLVSPCGSGPRGSAAASPLITHVSRGDAVFHFDEHRQAIVAWSTARWTAEKRTLRLLGHERYLLAGSDAPVARHAWAVTLEHTTPLEQGIPLAEIARIQWERFRALQALEDLVGEPLYYPFAMDSPSDSHLLSGHVFKLPSLFVEWFEPLDAVSQHLRWAARVTDPGRMVTTPRTAHGPRALPGFSRDPALGAG